MRISSRFPVAVQIMMIITALSGTRKINSKTLSEGIGVNAVIIRNIFKDLKQANMISVSPGPGGATLARAPETISLWEILIAVEQMDTDDVFRLTKQPDEHHQIARNIYGLLGAHLDTSIDAMKSELSKISLLTMAEELHDCMPELPPLPNT